MRRRFGRGRMNRGQGEARGASIDAARWFERIVAEGVLPVTALERVAADEVPDGFAVLATGTTEEGATLLVGFSPKSGGDAALATLAYAQRLLAEQGFTGESVALAPDWSIASRRRLELLRAPALRFRAMAVSGLADDGGEVGVEPAEPPVVVSPRQLAAQLTRSEDREIFLRGLEAFAGLAAKHGGAVRGTRVGAELVLLARRVAVLHARDGGVRARDARARALERAALGREHRHRDGSPRGPAAQAPERSARARGRRRPARADRAAARERWPGCAAALIWPLAGSDPEVLDLAAVAEDGRCVVAAVRERLTLPALAEILDATLALRPALPALLAGAPPPVLVGTPRLLLAAREYDALVLRALAAARSRDRRLRRARGARRLRAEPARPAARRADRAPRLRASRSPNAARASPSPTVRARESLAERGAREPARERRERESFAERGPARAVRRSPAVRRAARGAERSGSAARAEAPPRSEEPAAAAGAPPRFEASRSSIWRTRRGPRASEAEAARSRRRRAGAGAGGGAAGAAARAARRATRPAGARSGPGRRRRRARTPPKPTRVPQRRRARAMGRRSRRERARAGAKPADDVALVEPDDVEDLGTGLHPLVRGPARARGRARPELRRRGGVLRRAAQRRGARAARARAAPARAHREGGARGGAAPRAAAPAPPRGLRRARGSRLARGCDRARARPAPGRGLLGLPAGGPDDLLPRASRPICAARRRSIWSASPRRRRATRSGRPRSTRAASPGSTITTGRPRTSRACAWRSARRTSTCSREREARCRSCSTCARGAAASPTSSSS